MKLFTSLLLILFSLGLNAQTTFTGKLKTGWSADSLNYRITLPAGYPYSVGDSVQAIICFLGLGEVGTDTSKLTLYGPHARIKGGWNGGVGITNGTHFPILITMQEPAAYYNPFYYKRAIDTIMARYKIFRNSLHLTGYSMGGWTANSFVIYRASATDSSFSYRIKSIVNVQGVLPDDCKDATICPYPTAFPSFARNGGNKTNGYSWDFEQSNDYRRIVEITNAMNGAVAGTSQYIQTAFGSGGHGSFEQWYGNATTTPFTWTGFHPIIAAKQDIYQWMIRQGDTINDLHSGNSPPTVSAGGNQIITLPTNSSTLVGTATGVGASITSVAWTKDSGPNSPTFGSASATTTTVTGLIQGIYVFRLTATDSHGLTAYATMTLTVNGAGSGPTASAGGTYIVDQSNGYDLTLNGAASGSNLKINWTFPCNCFTGNDNFSPSSFTNGEPRVAKIVAPNQLNAQVIQMHLNNGDSVHRYKFVLTVTDSVTGQYATDTALVIYRYWNRFPPQNPDGAAGHHLCTSGEHTTYGCTTGVDMMIAGANANSIRNQFVSYQQYPTWSDTFHIAPGAKTYIIGGDYYNVHIEYDTAGGSGSQPLGDTLGAPIVITNYKGQVRTTQGFQFINIRNTKITGKYDPINHTGDINYQGHANGYAYSDSSYGLWCNNHYISNAGHGVFQEGKDSHKNEYEYVAATRGNFSGFCLKAEMNGLLNYQTRAPVYWNGLWVHDCLGSDAHGEQFYIGSANTPAVWIRKLMVENNRAWGSGNKLFKTIELYSDDTVRNNVGAFGSIDFVSPFSADVSIAQEVQLINVRNYIHHNLMWGFGNQGLNLLTNKYSNNPLMPIGANTIRANAYFHSWGTIGWFIGQFDSSFVLTIDSNYLGYHTQFLFGRIYNAPRGTNTFNQIYATTSSGVPPQATKNVINITNMIYDSTKYTLTQSNSVATFNFTNNTRIPLLVAPTFTNMGFNSTDFPVQWVDSIGRMWGDEYVNSEFKQGQAMFYDLGQVVKWFDKYYRSKINNNQGHPPTGQTDAYWTLILFSNGSYTPPKDVTLITTDPYRLKGIGLKQAGVASPPNCNCTYLICTNCAFK